MNIDKREAKVVERTYKKRKVYLVNYNPALKGDKRRDWITFGVYFRKDDADFVRDLIEAGKLILFKLQ